MCDVQWLNGRTPFVDYRPSSHHLLYKNDNSFDSKHSAALWCRRMVENVMENVFLIHNGALLKKMYDEIHTIRRGVSRRKLNITFVSSG